ncbi:hypothetical protein [Geodermatophilus sp. FMUSA9-8]|uniref:hypothetical protein n=1 Tax=Geodermatophilus sp. FMUSA9-8 TaxID=3120155 RepID=UPI0030083209
MVMAGLKRLLDRMAGPVSPEVVVVLPEPLAGQVRALLAEGKRTEAVTLTRQRTLLPMVPAVRAVDALAAPDR